MTFTRFTVTVEEMADGWNVKVDTGEGDDFAEVRCGDLETALEMALPYMRCAADADPFAFLLRKEQP